MISPIFRIANSLIFKLLVTLILGFLFGTYLPLNIQKTLFAISLTLKEMLLFILPFIIFTCIFTCLLSFKTKVVKIIILLITFICFSNFVSTLIGYHVFHLTLSNFHDLQKSQISFSNSLEPLWDLQIPSIVSNNVALFSGFIAGTIFSFYKNNKIELFSSYMSSFVTYFLNKIFVPTLPLFALGFVIKLNHDGILSTIMKSYLPLVFVIIVTQVIYIASLYFFGAYCNPKTFSRFLKNTLPAGLMGFSTMSSMAALPLTIRAAEKNTGQTQLPRTIAPATVNVHLIGDSIAIPMLALAILGTFDLPFPDLQIYLIFSFFFVIAKFAVAAIPGGGIIVMIPILEKYLGFTPEMAGIITALYILLDPIVTTANVMGNGAFTILTTKFLQRKKTIQAHSAHDASFN